MGELDPFFHGSFRQAKTLQGLQTVSKAFGDSKPFFSSQLAICEQREGNPSHFSIARGACLGQLDQAFIPSTRDPSRMGATTATLIVSFFKSFSSPISTSQRKETSEKPVPFASTPLLSTLRNSKTGPGLPCLNQYDIMTPASFASVHYMRAPDTNATPSSSPVYLSTLRVGRKPILWIIPLADSSSDS
ncbi:hypothetical protein CCUS01_04232 [Colletotrichum cuscutae]|uniref:Uncharacterized protein n=1 Tax=Colletotrichum cuscutae TaxID=1209917 RepID=A0AAI9VHQ5_9PEZI|nr:hypothetical protein CCUS01_04232 [Colletotrichum cuscutae]